MKKIILVMLTVTIIAAMIAAFVAAKTEIKTEIKTETETEKTENRFQHYDYEIIVDSETGVNYIFLYEEGDYGIKAMALSPLLDAEGKVVITKGGE